MASLHPYRSSPNKPVSGGNVLRYSSALIALLFAAVLPAEIARDSGANAGLTAGQYTSQLVPVRYADLGERVGSRHYDGITDVVACELDGGIQRSENYLVLLGWLAYLDSDEDSDSQTNADGSEQGIRISNFDGFILF